MADLDPDGVAGTARRVEAEGARAMALVGDAADEAGSAGAYLRGQ